MILIDLKDLNKAEIWQLMTKKDEEGREVLEKLNFYKNFKTDKQNDKVS